MILAVETSCDDSCVALIDSENGTLIRHEIAGQEKFHSKFGGVVPEIAGRGHLAALPELVDQCLDEVGIGYGDLKAVAATYTPGLIGSLLIGVSFAKALAWSQKIPFMPIDHLEGHLFSPMLDYPHIKFPAVALIVSGGHTHLLLAKGLGDYELLGKTMDDALGEAYDKVAKLLGLTYPGGPILDRLAAESDRDDFPLPIPLRGQKTLDFSYSGLKTAVRNYARSLDIHAKGQMLMDYQTFSCLPENETKMDVKRLAASFQRVAAETLRERCVQAVKKTGVRALLFSGGVSANQRIRSVLKETGRRNGFEVYYPRPEYCTDNAAMIAYVAWLYYRIGQFVESVDLLFEPSPFSPLNVL